MNAEYWLSESQTGRIDTFWEYFKGMTPNEMLYFYMILDDYRLLKVMDEEGQKAIEVEAMNYVESIPLGNAIEMTELMNELKYFPELLKKMMISQAEAAAQNPSAGQAAPAEKVEEAPKIEVHLPENQL